MTDRYAVVWTHTPAGPVKMGQLVATERECRFSYTDEFLHRRPAPGLGLLASAEVFDEHPVVYRSTERTPLHPRLMALIPGAGAGNLQRRLYTELLARRTPPPAPGFETEWALLLMTGHGGIGHVDVFADDREAERWYAQGAPHPQTLIGGRSAVWQYVREALQQHTHEVPAETVAALIGPTPSVGGMIPKLLATIPDRPRWEGRFAAPGATLPGDTPAVQVVLKIEPMHYPGLAELEALCLDVHRELGFEVPRHWRAQLEDLQLLAVERFDRTPAGLPVAMESFLSVMASGSHAIQGSGDTDLAAVGAMLEKLATVVNLDTRQAQREVYLRFLAAVVTGNGDLHLENLSFIGGPDAVRVAPVYDPAPMRAWPRHDLRSAIPIMFDPALGLGDNLAQLATAFGMTRREGAERLAWMLERTRDYPQRVRALSGVPLERREALAGLMERERAAIGGSLSGT